MDHYIPIRLHASLFHALSDSSGEGFWGAKTEAALAQAVRDWISANKSGQPASAAASPVQGYQWKQLFLPHGTLLRITLATQTHYAQVEGERLLCAGQALSPSQFANLHSGTRRNAWKTLWLRRPGDAGWQRAQDCRVAQLPVFGN